MMQKCIGEVGGGGTWGRGGGTCWRALSPCLSGVRQHFEVRLAVSVCVCVLEVCVCVCLCVCVMSVERRSNMSVHVGPAACIDSFGRARAAHVCF